MKKGRKGRTVWYYSTCVYYYNIILYINLSITLGNYTHLLSHLEPIYGRLNTLYTDIRYTDLRYTDLRYSDLRYSDLRYLG